MSLYQNGNTPLHLAAREGKTETAEMLLKHGESIDIQNEVSALSS